MSPFAFFSRHPRGELSAYIDGQLPASRAGRIAAHLDSCAPCAEEVTALRALSTALRELPDVAAPRSFALTPAHVADTRRVPEPTAYRGGGDLPLANGFRVATVGLAFALAAVVFVDVGGVVDDDGTRRNRSGDDAALILDELAATESLAQESALDAGGEGFGDDASAPYALEGGGDGDDSDLPDDANPPDDRNSNEGPGVDRPSGADADASGAAADEGDATARISGLSEDNEDSASPAAGDALNAISGSDDGSGGSTLLLVEITLAAALIAALIATLLITRARKFE